MAQALVRYLCNQFTEIDGERCRFRRRLRDLRPRQRHLPLRSAGSRAGHAADLARPERAVDGAAAIGFAKAKRRRQIMVAASSIGPGATNMVTAAGLAHANRLPVLLLAGDTFVNRRPDPVMQQVEHFGNPTITVNDAFKAGDAATGTGSRSPSRSSARCRRRSPRCSIRPIAARPSCRSARTRRRSPRTIRRPSSPRPCMVDPAPAPRPRRLAEAVELLKRRRSRSSSPAAACAIRWPRRRVAQFALDRGIPVAETIAGKGAVTHDHPAHVGPIGIVGSTSANALAPRRT